jgi:CxxC motif-containing protein
MEMICIVCPNSCRLQVSKTENDLQISGEKCKRGREFAISEWINPKRMFTSTVEIEDAVLPRLPVATTAEIPKSKIFEIQRIISDIQVKAPIQCNEVMLYDICNTGVDLVATRSMKKIPDPMVFVNKKAVL